MRRSRCKRVGILNGFGLDLGEQGVILNDTSTSIEEPVLPVKKLITDGGVHLLKTQPILPIHSRSILSYYRIRYQPERRDNT